MAPSSVKDLSWGGKCCTLLCTLKSLHLPVSGCVQQKSIHRPLFAYYCDVCWCTYKLSALGNERTSGRGKWQTTPLDGFSPHQIRTVETTLGNAPWLSDDGHCPAKDNYIVAITRAPATQRGRCRTDLDNIRFKVDDWMNRFKFIIIIVVSTKWDVWNWNASATHNRFSFPPPPPFIDRHSHSGTVTYISTFCIIRCL